MENKTSLLVRWLAGIAVVSLVLLMAHTAITHTPASPAGRALEFFFAASLAAVIIAMFANFMKGRGFSDAQGRAPAGATPRGGFRAAVIGIAIIIVGIAIVLPVAYFEDSIPVALYSLIIRVIAPAIVFIGIFVITRAVYTTMQRW